MSELSVRDLLSGKIAAGSDVTLKGWVRTRRDSKQGFSFINLHDGSCFDAIQVVADKSMPGYQEDVLHLTTGCAIVATGKLVESKGRGQSFEVQAHGIEVLGWVDDPDTYPVSAKRHTFEHLREVAHLRPRTNTIGAIARLRHSLAQAVHRYMSEHGFVWIHTPIITASDCEGAGELFRVSTLDFANIPRDAHDKPDFSADFFGREAFLTVSGQLNVECYCLALSKVYTFGPTFRAENSNTSRHLAEFWMIEPEIAFADLNDNADLAESFLKSVIKSVLEERVDDMAFFAERIDKTIMSRLEGLVESEFARMDYSEAIDILKGAGKRFEFPVEWGLDLQSEHERYLAEEHVGRPVVVMNYPEDIKAFYMRRNDDGKTVAAMDVLVPGAGEIVGGSQREERLEVLDLQLKKMGLSEQLWWYRDLRRYGTVPHAGFGLGFERLLYYITGMGNVRDLIPFPRTPKSAPF
jgi:asparaginyl-tRNA synthetase